MYNPHYVDLKSLLEIVKPTSLLLIDPNPLPIECLAVAPDCRVIHLHDNILPQLQTLGHFDLGVVANILEYLDTKTAGTILARLRDLHTKRFVALVPVGPGWTGRHWAEADLLGYGMNIMARYRVDGKALYLYHYAIESYKTTPDWFNSKHWAHPERWKP